VVAPADPSRFDDMFGASPAQLAKMRSATAASAASASASSPLINPGKFDNMYGASPAQLATLRSGSNAHSSSSSASHAAAAGAGADRFIVVYDVESPNEAECREKILAICLEQTVELPASLVPEGTWIRDNVVVGLKLFSTSFGSQNTFN
jgi:ribulose-bisphosphate carboxylase large chain